MLIKFKSYILLLVGIIMIPTSNFAATTIRIDMDANTPGLQTDISVIPGESFTTSIEIVLDNSADSLSTFGFSVLYASDDLNTPVTGDINTFPLSGGWTDLGYSAIMPSYIDNFAQVNFNSSQGPLTAIVATINWTVSNNTSNNSVEMSPGFYDPIDAAYDINNNSVIPVFEGGTVNISSAPGVTIAEILMFFDESVEAGTLEGSGKRHDISRKRLKAMRKLLMGADKSIENDNMDRACVKLERANRNSDGQPKPRDLVVGEAVPELNTLIQNLMASLGCE